MNRLAALVTVAAVAGLVVLGIVLAQLFPAQWPLPNQGKPIADNPAIADDNPPDEAVIWSPATGRRLIRRSPGTLPSLGRRALRSVYPNRERWSAKKVRDGAAPRGGFRRGKE